MTSRFIPCIRLVSCVHWVSCYTQETTLFSVIQQHIVKMFAFHIFPFLPRFPLPRFPPLHYGAVISTPAFSTPALRCRVFHSRVFHSCSMVPRFPLPRFPLPRIQRPLFMIEVILCGENVLVLQHTDCTLTPSLIKIKCGVEEPTYDPLFPLRCSSSMTPHFTSMVQNVALHAMRKSAN